MSPLPRRSQTGSSQKAKRPWPVTEQPEAEERLGSISPLAGRSGTTAICARSGRHLRQMKRLGVGPKDGGDGASKVEARNLVERLGNVPGRRARGLHQRQHRDKSDAGLFLLLRPDHYSHGRTAQWPGRSSTGSRTSIAACWRAPHQGDQITVQLSFKRDGSIFGKPKVNYVKPMNGSSAHALSASIFQAIDACLPLDFTPLLAANIAGQVFVIGFVAP